MELQSDENITNLEQWRPTTKCNEHRAVPCELCERDRGRSEEAGISRRLASRHVVWTRPKVWLAYGKQNFYKPFASRTDFLTYFSRILPCEIQRNSWNRLKEIALLLFPSRLSSPIAVLHLSYIMYRSARYPWCVK